METLAALQARVARPGTVTWIGVRPTRRASLTAVASAYLGLAGLEGDHARAGKRAVTLIQAEHLAAIASLAGLASVSAFDLRRNLLISGINLTAMRGRSLAIGGAVVTITAPCAPCSRMEESLGPGGYTAMRGHGGWCARVETPGPVAVSDPVAPAAP